MPSNRPSENNRICPQCGTRFACGIASGDERCWCFNLPNVIPTADIATGGEGCLCPDCLQARIAQQSWHMLDIPDDFDFDSDGQWSN